jgi:hypothetical protein
MRIRARQPVREDSHEPGDLGVRRSSRCHSGHLPHGPELRPAPSQPEPAERSPAVRAASEGQRLRRRSVGHLRRGVVGGGNRALGSGRQGAQRSGISAARRQVPRSDTRVPGHRAVSDETTHTGAIRPGGCQGRQGRLHRREVRPGSGERSQQIRPVQLDRESGGNTAYGGSDDGGPTATSVPTCMHGTTTPLGSKWPSVWSR